MITRMVSVTIYVLNLQNAISFYVDKLGFEIHTDIIIEPGYRWISICIPGQPAQQLMLIPVEEGMLFKGKQVEQMRDLIRQEIFSYALFSCRNLDKTYLHMRSKGIRFLMPPGEGFMQQREAAFVDDSGNWFRLTEEEDAI